MGCSCCGEGVDVGDVGFSWGAVAQRAPRESALPLVKVRKRKVEELPHVFLRYCELHTITLGRYVHEPSDRHAENTIGND